MKRQILSSVVVWMYVLLCPRDVTKLIVAQAPSLTGPTDTYMECPDEITTGQNATFTCKVHNSFNTSFCPGTADIPYKLTIEFTKPTTNVTQTVCKIDAPVMDCSEAAGSCGCQSMADDVLTIKAVRDVKATDAAVKVQCFSFCLFSNNTVIKNPGPSKSSCEALKLAATSAPPAAAEGPNIGLIAGLVVVPIVLIAVFLLVLKKKPAESAPPPAPSSAPKGSEDEEEGEEGEGEEEEGGGEEGGEEEDA